MRRILFSFLLSAGFATLPLAAIGQAQDDMMDHCGMHEMMHEQGMGMMGGGPGMGGGCSDCGTGMGMMEGYGGRGMRGLGPIGMLDLTTDQRSKLNRIQSDLRKQHLAQMSRIVDEQAKLYDLYAADRPDAKKIGTVYGAIFDIRRQMIESQIDAMNRAKDILTKEQQARLKQLRQYRGMGPDGMNRSGYMHEQMRDMMSSGTGSR